MLFGRENVLDIISLCTWKQISDVLCTLIMAFPKGLQALGWAHYELNHYFKLERKL